MKIKFIKLIQNELIKIFKRKSIYFLFLISIIAVIIYNYKNPDQNPVLGFDNNTSDYNIEAIENTLDKIPNNTEHYIMQKVSIELYKVYNSFEEGSWQRYALKEETTEMVINDVNTNYNLDIKKYLENIIKHELNSGYEISEETYNIYKTKYNEYLQALNSNDWKEFVRLKIRNLKELKDASQDELNIEIEYYNLRLENNINFGNNILNQYLHEYKSNSYLILAMKTYENESQAFINENINRYKANMSLCKYAIENNINYDISNNDNLITDNKIDARISFIRTFEHFDIIMVIIIIYISTTIVTEETNKGTIKGLLTKPHKRSTILLSKILACIITTIIAMVIVLITQFIVGGVIFGFDSYKLDYIGYNFNNEQVFTMNLFIYNILVGISKLPMYIIMILFCIFIGVVSNHTSMSMIVTLIIFLISDTVLKEWSKVETLSLITRYFITNNWDFSIYLFGGISNISGVTLISSIFIYIVYMIILLALSIYKFKKKEINNVP